jgi:large subunit ribosomal protein L21
LRDARAEAHDKEPAVYAVIATGGKQYRVTPGQQVTVEKLTGDIGDTIELRPVMLVDDGGSVTTGRDIGDRAVKATITGHDRDKRIRVFNYKNKSRQHKRRGHRQHRTTVRIEEI